MNDLERLQQIQDVVIEQKNTIDATLDLIDKWLIGMENRLNTFGENTDV
jgi:hypothetical protein